VGPVDRVPMAEAVETPVLAEEESWSPTQAPIVA
jgi:hypothetical protein